MRQSSTTIFGENKTILELAGDLFQNINIKVNKSDVSSSLDNGILKAGTIVNKSGVPVNDNTAFGLVYNDINFTNSTGTEIVPVLIFGFVKTKVLPAQPEEATKLALPLIKFL